MSKSFLFNQDKKNTHQQLKKIVSFHKMVQLLIVNGRNFSSGEIVQVQLLLDLKEIVGDQVD